MKTLIADIFPKLQRFSQRLDNLTLLTNKHWVSLGDIQSSKIVYIFRSNNELLISTNGRVEKASWDYIGNNSLLIETASKGYLFKHGFFDENILALKIDGSKEYAVFVNESKYGGELNSIDKVSNFLKYNYFKSISNDVSNNKRKIIQHHTDKGILETTECDNLLGQDVYLNGQPAPDGLYKFPFFGIRVIRNGKILR